MKVLSVTFLIYSPYYSGLWLFDSFSINLSGLKYLKIWITMGNRKAKQFWMGISNISTVTTMINSKRNNQKHVYFNTQEIENQILQHKKTKEENLISLRKILKNKNIFDLYGSVMNDMYKFKFSDESSVDYTIQKTCHSVGDLDKLSRISLLEHSFGVFNQMYLSNKSTYGQFSDFFLLSALIHDFGKSPTLRTEFNLSSDEPHHKNSAKYLELKIDTLKKNFTKEEKLTLGYVVDAIRVHHDNFNKISSIPLIDKTKEDQFEENSFRQIILDFLKVADSKQRSIEIEFVEQVITKVESS